MPLHNFTALQGAIKSQLADSRVLINARGFVFFTKVCFFIS
jgi:hypothetical protein